jgi:hypothetical protein
LLIDEVKFFNTFGYDVAKSFGLQAADNGRAYHAIAARHIYFIGFIHIVNLVFYS